MVVSSSVAVDVVEELLSSLLFLAQEMMVKLKRNMESNMSICLTWIPFGGLGRTSYITSIGLFYKKWEDCGGLSDCEVLSGSYSQEMMGVSLKFENYKF